MRERFRATGGFYRREDLFDENVLVLVDEPKDEIFAPFGDTRCKIEGEAVKSREMHFANYQGIARDTHR
jgi:type I restriction enzyme R subunit